MENRKLKYRFRRQLFKTAWTSKDLQKIEMSYQAPNCNIDCHLITYENKAYIFKEHEI